MQTLQNANLGYVFILKSIIHKKDINVSIYRNAKKR